MATGSASGLRERLCDAGDLLRLLLLLAALRLRDLLRDLLAERLRELLRERERERLLLDLHRVPDSRKLNEGVDPCCGCSASAVSRLHALGHQMHIVKACFMT